LGLWLWGIGFGGILHEIRRIFGVAGVVGEYGSFASGEGK
jgi:hypothetical protein